MIRIEIKYENPPGKQIIVHQRKNFQQFVLIQDIIQGVADTEYGSNSAVQLQFPHILLQIQDFRSALFLFFHGNIQHGSGGIHPYHIIAFPIHQFRQRPRAAAQVNYQVPFGIQHFFRIPLRP